MNNSYVYHYTILNDGSSTYWLYGRATKDSPWVALNSFGSYEEALKCYDGCLEDEDTTC